MRITFDGPTLTNLVEQARNFSLSFHGEVATNHISPLVHPSSNQRPVAPKVSASEILEKRRPGRPPKEESKKGKAAKAVYGKAPQQVAKPSQQVEVSPTQVDEDFDPFEIKPENILVGPPGFEPGESVADNTPNPIKVITKEVLTDALQALVEKESTQAGDQKAGLNKVREIFAQFGISRLSDLDSKRFHEMYAVVEKTL